MNQLENSSAKSFFPSEKKLPTQRNLFVAMLQMSKVVATPELEPTPAALPTVYEGIPFTIGDRGLPGNRGHQNGSNFFEGIGDQTSRRCILILRECPRFNSALFGLVSYHDP